MFAFLAAFPEPIAVRDPRGFLIAANAPALQMMDSVDQAGLILIQRGCAPEPNLYLVETEAGDPRRFSAFCSVARVGGRAVELLRLQGPAELREMRSMVDRIEELGRLADQAARAAAQLDGRRDPELRAVRANTRALAAEARRLRMDIESVKDSVAAPRPNDEPAPAVDARSLTATLVRRLRRHLDVDSRSVEVDHDLDQANPIVRIEPLTAAQIVLSGLDVLHHRGGDPTRLSVRPSGCRLRIALHATSPPFPSPDLARHSRLLDELRPLLRSAGASIELKNHPRRASQFVLVVPTTASNP